jgi:hypothetical protein
VFADCDIARDNCGSIDPGGNFAWAADGAHNTADETLFFVGAGADGGVFQVDPVTCTYVEGTYATVSYYSSERAIGYDPEYHDIWHGGWIEEYILQNDATPPYAFLSGTYVGQPIASMAVNDDGNYLFVGMNNYPDMLYVYDITGGELGSLLGTWAVPWQAPSGGWVMAGMEFDPDAGQLVMINQYGNYSGTDREIFDFSLGSGLTGAGWCDLASTGFGWGIALVGDGDPAPTSFLSYVPDIGDFALPFDLDEYGIPEVYPPYDLVCVATPENNVQLTWTNGDAYEEIRVYKEDDLIATLPGDATEYLADFPGMGHHVYGVSGVIGTEESTQAGCELDIYGVGTCFDFNETDGGWVAGGTADGYEWGTPSYVFDGDAWETNVGGTYTNNACTWVDSPAINLGPEGGWVTFDSWDYTECYWDGWTLQISLDGGASFSCISPLEGYDQVAPYGAGNCPEFLYCDSNCGYSTARFWNFDLTAYPNVSVIFRFVFASDGSVAYQGHVFDNFCVYGGSVPSVLVQCQLLNPDMDGDGTRDVHVGDYLHYSATFVNLTPDPVDYGAAQYFYESDCCPDPEFPFVNYYPECKGTLPGGGIATHYYRVLVPNVPHILENNPFAVEVAAWECVGGTPAHETGRCCFDVTLLPAWEPPPVSEPMDGFMVEEIDTWRLQ